MKYKNLKCENCGNNFVWSDEERELYAKKGISEPEYCPICRGIIEAQSRDMNRARMENKNIEYSKGKS